MNKELNVKKITTVRNELKHRWKMTGVVRFEHRLKKLVIPVTTSQKEVTICNVVEGY